MKLTAAWLQSRSKPENRPATRYDTTIDGRQGLMVRVFPSGEISFRYRYTFGNKRRIMLLGSYGDDALSLADAFSAHHRAASALANGIDPQDEREQRIAQKAKERREREEADTVASIVEQFVHRKLRAEHWDEAQRTWVRDPKSTARPRKRPEAAEALLRTNLVEAKLDGQTVGKMKAHELTRKQAVKLLLKIVDRKARVTANRVHALLVQLFDWAASMDLVPASIMAGTIAPGGKEFPRERTLSDEEIAAVWEKLATAKMEPPTRLALKLLLLTGQRRGQLTNAQWAHFDLDRQLWTIPIELQKSEGRGEEPTRPHVVPLSVPAMNLVSELHSITGTSRWVLPSQHRKLKPQRPYSERALTRAVAKNIRHFGLPHWTPHDLRRTAITGMSKLGVIRLHIKKAVGHKIAKDMTEVYDQYDFLKEKRAALDAWSEQVLAIVTAGSTATPAKDQPEKEAREAA
jgi:integrase